MDVLSPQTRDLLRTADDIWMRETRQKIRWFGWLIYAMLFLAIAILVVTWPGGQFSQLVPILIMLSGITGCTIQRWRTQIDLVLITRNPNVLADPLDATSR